MRREKYGRPSTSRGGSARNHRGGTTLNITVNGESIQVTDVVTVGDLLDHFRVQHQAVAVIANGDIIARDVFGQYLVQAGDTIDIIRFVGGG